MATASGRDKNDTNGLEDDVLELRSDSFKSEIKAADSAQKSNKKLYAKNKTLHYMGYGYSDDNQNNSIEMTQVYVPKEYYIGAKGNYKKDINMRLDHNMRMKNRSDNQLYFDRLYSVYPDKELDNICQYVFFVRPDTNIFDESSSDKLSSACAKNAFMRYMKATYPKILLQLSSNLTPNNDFMPYLVGRTESLQIPDYSIKNYSLNQPYTNLLIPYAGHGLESMTGGTFDVSFREDNEFRIHKLFQAWLTYINGVVRNTMVPKYKHISQNKIDYATSVYCITCAADGKTILYWSKYTGAFPTTVPNSDLSFNLRGSVPNKLNIPFSYFLCESMEPYILADFNKNARMETPTSEGAPIYNEDVAGTGYGLTGSPYIYRAAFGSDKKPNFINTSMPYMLGWKDSNDLESSVNTSVKSGNSRVSVNFTKDDELEN